MTFEILKGLLYKFIVRKATEIKIHKITAKQLCSAHDVASKITIDSFLSMNSVKFTNVLSESLTQKNKESHTCTHNVHECWNNFIPNHDTFPYVDCMNNIRSNAAPLVEHITPSTLTANDFVMTSNMAQIFVLLYTQQQCNVADYKIEICDYLPSTSNLAALKVTATRNLQVGEVVR